ncbi:dihydroorotase [candidate division KSB1 bacterium]|nr:dihydroorotase [candidate division KSB1 bacterium]
MLKKLDKYLFKGGKIIDPLGGSMKQLDLVVVNGIIDKTGQIEQTQFAGQIIDITDHIVAPGLFDMHVHLREPGREDQETIKSGCAAAMAGGFTEICSMPDTEPACDKQEVVRFIKKHSESELVNVNPIAAITKKRAGSEITEMAELRKAGAVAFSDAENPVVNSAVMRRALEYSSMYDMTIIDHCEELKLTANGQMNESMISTRLGLLPMPNAAEEIIIARDIFLAELTGGKVHIPHISTRRGVDLVRRAKNEGLKITCEVAPHQLILSDESVVGYDTNFKVNPPFRRPEDIDALKEGLKDGTIDVIASDHSPYSIEEKDVEFNVAPFGIIGLETMLGIINTHIVREGILSLEKAVSLMSIQPRNILNLPVPEIREGETANITIFNPDKKVKIERAKLHSLSKNTPFDGRTFYGSVKCVMNKGLLWMLEE